MPPKVKYSISVFDKYSEKYIGEFEFINHIEVNELRSILRIGEDQDQLYDEYPIDLQAAKKIEKMTNGSFDLSKFEYFLSCERTD
ncbi:hypothetical protein NP554_28990 [Pseudomonas asiatica]|uniref:DUF7683 domain-containing protein n=1 Tax=Pseudomonas asiatica TaxID=2219225 RepID=A0A9X4I0H1_9PSED|nr:hypothetical protein [Pseudomonas asiatica]MDD2115836.1 hypothetical protein [Pseudomonas asiatica]WJN52452.1 hypothetical protein QUR91_11830 [Pseudomonas asiatica]